MQTRICVEVRCTCRGEVLYSNSRFRQSDVVDIAVDTEDSSPLICLLCGKRERCVVEVSVEDLRRSEEILVKAEEETFCLSLSLNQPSAAEKRRGGNLS